MVDARGQASSSTSRQQQQRPPPAIDPTLVDRRRDAVELRGVAPSASSRRSSSSWLTNDKSRLGATKVRTVPRESLRSSTMRLVAEQPQHLRRLTLHHPLNQSNSLTRRLSHMPLTLRVRPQAGDHALNSGTRPRLALTSKTTRTRRMTSHHGGRSLRGGWPRCARGLCALKGRLLSSADAAILAGHPTGQAGPGVHLSSDRHSCRAGARMPPGVTDRGM